MRVLEENAQKAQKTTETKEDSANLSCNQEMMSSYGLTGMSKPEISKHLYCPSITKNCCSKKDQILSMQLWQSENKYLVEKYFETYLFSIKYIIGYSVEATKLANEFKDQEGICQETAQDLLDMNLNPTITRDIYDTYNKALETLGELRKGFYCILCDAKTQEKLADFWQITNLFYKDRIYLSKEFCRTFVDKTIRSSFFSVYYLKRFAENLVQLMSCKMGEQQELVYEISFWQQQLVKNCYYFKDKFFYFFCEEYCQEFHLVKPSGLFDGDLGELQKFVEYISENKNKVFQSPSNNILMYMVTYEDDLLQDNFRKLKNINKYFTASTKQVKLDEFKTDVYYFGGMDPFESTGNSLYPLEIANLVIFSTLMSLLFLIQLQ